MLRVQKVIGDDDFRALVLPLIRYLLIVLVIGYFLDRLTKLAV